MSGRIILVKTGLNLKMDCYSHLPASKNVRFQLARLTRHKKARLVAGAFEGGFSLLIYIV